MRKKTNIRQTIIWTVSILIAMGLGAWWISELEVPQEIELDEVPRLNARTVDRVGLILPISVEDPGMAGAGATWYLNWSHEPHKGVDMEFVPLVWGYSGDEQISMESFSEIEQIIRENPEQYPDDTLFLVGNKISLFKQSILIQ